MTRKQPADPVTARELALYAINDSNTHHGCTAAVIANLARKRRKGTYNPTLAPKAWRYVADLAAKRYTHEFGTPGARIFSPADRDMAALEIMEHYEEAVAEAAAVRTQPADIA